MPWLGIDIGGTSVKAALLDSQWDPSPRATGRSAEYARPDRETLHNALVQAGRAALEGAGFSDGAIEGVGLCLPGLLDDAKQRVLVSANLPGLQGLEIAPFLQAALAEMAVTRPQSLRPTVASDAHAAARDFWCLTRAQSGEEMARSRLLVLALGTGVGACVLDDGEPLLVSGGGPGHLGQVDVSWEDTHAASTNSVPLGPDGGRGGLEGYLGVPALRARYGTDFVNSMKNWTTSDPPVRALVRVLRIAHAVYRPQRVALVGFVGVSLRHLGGEIRSCVDRELTRVARSGWTLEFGHTSFHAAGGAARLAARSAGSP